jgi:hypothetical protein
MNADKITLASYIAYLQGMYKRYGNISIAQLKHIERNRKKRRISDEHNNSNKRNHSYSKRSV